MRFSLGLMKLCGALALVLVAGCGNFRTAYQESVAASQSAGWRLASVDVTAPRTLVVSEAEVLIPKADIVWREDKAGNRYEQVEAIMKAAVAQGAQGLNGGRPVAIDVTVTRFHAMTFLAEAKAPTGIHDIEFNLQVKDAASGEVLFGPEHVEASFPAMTGEQMARARAAGQSQKSQITAHVARTVRGLLGLGPDARQTFAGVGA